MKCRFNVGKQCELPTKIEKKGWVLRAKVGLAQKEFFECSYGLEK